MCYGSTNWNDILYSWRLGEVLFTSHSYPFQHSLNGIFLDRIWSITPVQVCLVCSVKHSKYSMLDTQAPQNYFYFNIVDWSSHNILAVGLTNTIYFWNSCISKVSSQCNSCKISFLKLEREILNKILSAQITKLCDLGVEDIVCSVC
jgi:hypothetical protein